MTDYNQGKWVHNYCILSGRYLYFYKEKDQVLYSDYISLKNIQMSHETLPEDKKKGKPKLFQLTISGGNQVHRGTAARGTVNYKMEKEYDRYYYGERKLRF